LLGNALSFSNPQFETPSVHQFAVSAQRFLGWNTVVDVAYVGSRTRDEQNRWGGFNEPPLALRELCDPLKGGTPGFCNEQLNNPFYGVSGFEGTSRFTSEKLSRYELSRPYPQFGQITVLDRNDGRIWYDSAQVSVAKRVSEGFSLTAAYTFAKAIEENGGDNQIGGTAVTNPLIVEVDRVLQRSPPESDRRHRLSVSGIYTLPFDDGDTATGGRSLSGLLMGGWQVAAIWLFNTGRPWGLPQDAYYLGNGALPQVSTSATAIRAVRPCVVRLDGTVVLDGTEGDRRALQPAAHSRARSAGCSEAAFLLKPSTAYSPGVSAFRDDRIRRLSLSQLDMTLSKTTRVTAGLRVQVRLDIFNVLNQPMYDERQYQTSTSNNMFGAIDRTSIRQSNVPRTGQLGVKLIF
jgi:hypothetical protein